MKLGDGDLHLIGNLRRQFFI